MINLPHNAALMTQMMPTQNVPVQTSHNNFQPFQQPPTSTQQMQTNPAYPINPQDPYKSPFYQLHHSDMFMANQYIPNVLQPRMYPPSFQPFNNVPPPLQTQPNPGPLLQNILEQIRGQVSNTAPIFILPGCQQSTNHHQQAGTPSQGGGPQTTGQPTSFNYPSSVHYPPSFYPYPIPLPVYDPFVGQARNRESSRGCGCCHGRQGSLDPKNYSLNCCCNLTEPEDHRCTATNDDTICSKRNCPASVSLQALASQFLSLPGIVSCAATRLILRKVPGSNITNTMEDTMEKAQKAIGMLTKEQLLMESRNAQQVNALINLHMTTNPPANIIPLLTLLQLKVNVMKAQIESLINKKVMECQGFGYEVETSGPIDPTVLTMKTNEELRHLLSALRQKECDERVNVNFSPYHSQRVIAESRLNNVQAKIRQVEAEFDRRRSVSLPVPSLTSRVIQQFAGSSCTFGYAQTRLFEPYESPDPFTASPRNPKRLYLKPHTPGPERVQQNDPSKATSTSEDTPSTCKDTGTGENTVDCSKERSVGPRSSEDTCSCHSTSSEDSVDEDKKKLRPKIDSARKTTISNLAGLENASLANFSPDVTMDRGSCKFNARTVSDDEKSKIPEIFKDDEDKETPLAKTDYVEAKGDEDLKDKLQDPAKEQDFVEEERVELEQLVIKEEDKSDADTREQFGEEGIRTEPGDASVSIKTEDPKEIPAYFETTVIVDVKPETMRTELYIEPKQKTVAQPSDSRFVTEKHIKIDDKSDQLKKFKMKDVEEQKTRNADESTHIPVRFKLKPEVMRTEQLGHEQKEVTRIDEATTKVQVDSKPTKMKTQVHLELKPRNLLKIKGEEPSKKSTVEDVSKKEAAEKQETAPRKNYFGVTLKKTGKLKEQSKIVVHENEHNLGKKEIKPENGGSYQKSKINDVKTKEKLILEATGSATSADGQATSGQESSEVKKNYFGITLRKKEESIGRSEAKDDETSSKNGKQRNVQIVSLMTHVEYDKDFGDFDEWTDVNRRIVAKKPQLINYEDDYDRKHEKMFPTDRRANDEKYINGTAPFPPLKRTETPENVFHSEEVESDCSRTICDRSVPRHLRSKTENSLASSIYSVIGNQLASFGTLLTYVLNLQDVSGLSYKKSSGKHSISVSNREEAIFDAKNNKKAVSRKDDWTLLTWGANDCDDDGTSGEGSIQVHEMKQSIIVDKETNNYVLIGGSVSGQLGKLSRSGFQQPYQTRRTLLIRSRLKNPGQQPQPPFEILKRPRKYDTFVSQAKQANNNQLETDNKNSNSNEKVNKNCSLVFLDHSFNS